MIEKQSLLAFLSPHLLGSYYVHISVRHRQVASFIVSYTYVYTGASEEGFRVRASGTFFVCISSSPKLFEIDGRDFLLYLLEIVTARQRDHGFFTLLLIDLNL